MKIAVNNALLAAQSVKKIIIFLTLYFCHIAVSYSADNELLNLSVEDLLNVQVTSVSKKVKSLNDSPAAIYVISQEDIKRIGATSIPEALRLAPGVNVSRIDAHKWAVSARGFNGRFANKLLVLIDGRHAYTRAFAGVYWENQDVMLEDVERIEVIRGPGATLWGANAVNGVINIITKHTVDTLGGLVSVGGGTEEQAFASFRYGRQLNADTTARIYIKAGQQDENSTAEGAPAGDDWYKIQGGFRMDTQLSFRDSLTIQGDAYFSELNQMTVFPQVSPPYRQKFNESIGNFGGNFLLRQKHSFSPTSDYSLQLYYDYYQRDESALVDSQHTIDIDFQHRFSLFDWNDVVWGVGYRFRKDAFLFSDVVRLRSASRNDQLFNTFVQDEITLVDNQLWLTLGSKFEYNDYSGFEIQPSAKLMWAPHHQHRLWAGVSRTVRTPSRYEHDIRTLQYINPPTTIAGPPFVVPAVAINIEGSNAYGSEQVLSYELGYRTSFIKDLSLDFTVFYNNYRKLRSAELGSTIVKGAYLQQTYFFTNTNRANTYGFEVSSVWQMLNWWRWDVNYSLIKTDLTGRFVDDQLSSGPQQLVSIRSATSITQNIEFDLLFRYVDKNSVVTIFADQVINDYFSLDIRLAWQPVKQVEIALVGKNLLADHHLEYKQESFTVPTEIDRGMYANLIWHF